MVTSGPQAGQCFALEPGRLTLGRTRAADLFLNDDSVSRRHVEIIITCQGMCYARDLGSTNGTRINNKPIGSTPHRLMVGDEIRLSNSVTLKLRERDRKEEALQNSLYNLAIHDPLTNAYNKRYLADRIDTEVAVSWRRGRPLSLLIFDIDHFKRLNDTFGHAAGDEVLQKLARRVMEVLRDTDIFARFGGEEFVVLMQNTPLHDAEHIAERLRAAAEALRIPFQEHHLQVTISIGLSSTSEGDRITAMDLFSRADQRMYQAKGAGRNRICSVSGQGTAGRGEAKRAV